MNILIIATHPNISKSEINSVWIKELSKEKNIEVRFLDELYPDRNISIESEQEALLKADRIIFQFPFYWYSTPSLLRDYFDTVFSHGWAYGPNGSALKDKEFMVAVSIGAPEYSYQGGSYNNFTLTELLRPFEATANALQMIYVPYFAVFDTPRLSHEDILVSSKKYIAHANNEDINHRKFLEKLKQINPNSSFEDM